MLSIGIKISDLGMTVNSHCALLHYTRVSRS